MSGHACCEYYDNMGFYDAQGHPKEEGQTDCRLKWALLQSQAVFPVTLQQTMYMLSTYCIVYKTK